MCKSRQYVKAVKRSQKGEDAILIRAYAAWGREVSTELSFGFDPEWALETNLIEDERTDVEVEGNEVQLDFSPVEIKSLKVLPHKITWRK
ncbi:MAG: glycosyl hydrolase-related protein [Candidatus Bipolaricaulota bacterium]